MIFLIDPLEDFAVGLSHHLRRFVAVFFHVDENKVRFF